LLMMRDRDTGRILYTERLERRPGEKPWECIRRSVRHEAQVRKRSDGERLQVIVGWGAGSVEEYLESYPEYGRVERTGGEAGDKVEEQSGLGHASPSSPALSSNVHRLDKQGLDGGLGCICRGPSRVG
jgi:hypothetical protein